jgi:hypothetical protein
MAIGKRKSGSGRLAELKWDCAIGKYILEERVCNDGVWESVQRNVDNDKFRAVFDLPNLQVGWIAYIKGLGRDTVLKPVGQDYGERPDKNYKEGLRLIVKMDGSLGGDVREFVSTLSYVWLEIDRLHDDYAAKAEKHKGCLPAVDVVDIRQEQGRDCLILIPIYKIAGWVPRPPDLPEAGIPIFRPTRKEPVDGTSSGNGSDNGNYERPRPDDGMDSELPSM